MPVAKICVGLTAGGHRQFLGAAKDGDGPRARALSGQMESFERDDFAPWSSTYFHRRMALARPKKTMLS